MKIIVTKNYDALSQKAAEIIKEKIIKKPNLVLGLATGSTPLRLYRELVRMHQDDALDFSLVTTFNLDEYVGLTRDHAQSYYYFMWENLFKSINIQKENIFIPDGLALDIVKFCTEYETEILKRDGIDLQVLGIGRDGHIGFNEPDEPFTSRTHRTKLTEMTIQDNARFFKNKEEVPREAITMGIGTIMDAKEILFLANGEHKAEIVARALQGEITQMVPASVLQKHQNLTVILDQEAAGNVDL